MRHSLLDGPVDGLASGGLLVVPVTLAKGLEFDHVIVVEPGRIAAAEARGLHRLYVALTRAVSRLTVLHGAAARAATLQVLDDLGDQAWRSRRRTARWPAGG